MEVELALVLCATVIDVLALGVEVKDVDEVNENDEVVVVEMLLVVVALALIVMVALVLEDALTDNDVVDVTDVVAVSDAEIVDDSETLRDIEPLFSWDMLIDVLCDWEGDMEFVIVAVTLDVDDKLKDDEDVALCDPLRVVVAEKLAVGLELPVVFVVYDVVLLLLSVEVIVVNNVDDDVNVVLLELLRKLLAVSLAVAVELVVGLWLVDVDAVSEGVPDDVRDALVVAESLPLWDALVVVVCDDVPVASILTEKESDANVVNDIDEVLLEEILLVLSVEAVTEDVNVLLLEVLTEKLAVLLADPTTLVVKLWLEDGDNVIESVPEDVSDTLDVAESLPVWDPLVEVLHVDVPVVARVLENE